KVDSLVMLPDTIFSFSFHLYYPYTAQPGENLLHEHFDHALDFDYGIELENAIVKSGKVKFEVLNQIAGNMICDFTINSALYNNTDMFFVSEILPAQDFISKTFDFSNYYVNFKGEQGNLYNTLNYSLDLWLHPDEPSGVLINPEDTFAINICFEDIILDYAKGYFGQNTYNFGPENTEFTLFDDLEIVNFSIEDANIFFRVENYYGIEGILKILELNAINNSNDITIPLEGDMIDSGMFINAAIQTGQGMYNIQPSIHTFDFSNTNFLDLFEIMPDEFSYTLEIYSNSLGDTTNHDNFFYLDAPIKTFINVEINEGISIEDLRIEKTDDWNSDNISFDNVNNGKLIMAFENGFPFSLNINIFLENNSGEILDTLIYEDLIASALIDENQLVKEPVKTIITIVLDDDMEQAIQEAEYARYVLLVNSAENEYVKVYSDYILKLKINGDFNLRIEQ
ncbi:MAG: hypothetical protein K8R58_13900, partial [Bacteroidales bacterium]|nr:hypothetical protein [Bacteroidales bacterium]